MAVVAPAVIPRSDADVRSIAQRIARRPLEVHIDYVGRSYGGQLGGEFLPKREAFADDVRYAAHIMEQDGDGALTEHFLECGVQTILMQYESNTDVASLRALAHKTHACGAAFAVALLVDTPLEVLEPLTHFIDGVQLMSIATIGAQGHPFDERVYGRMQHVQKMLTVPLYVDGGITRDRVVPLVERGASVLVVGSAIVKQEDPAAAYDELARLAQQ